MNHPNPRQAPLATASFVPSTTADTSRRNAIRANRAEARTLATDPLLTAQEAAAEAGVALSTWWKHVKSGRFPAPTYPLPRCPRWRRSEVQAAALQEAV
ncbi:helix-turn-helix transcriptional regulator [Pseudoroseomonas cervicalis]|uniref:Transcriptional regulator, AlpA family n=1 Tax=Pseudoroseomonas cervicalis ATCC 49957 TaxID=525371 RepID=D5RQ69_9PROT|nr:hypothetical protein [Pseudoroseomonas cervicalis]EFH10527.1 hypothetical protein HMPREF0731_3231 [Pseudoroseomonas cervicalis ATCC 49957]